jgi:hypothetical protein
MANKEIMPNAVRHFCIAFALIISSLALGSVKSAQPTQLSGYKGGAKVSGILGMDTLYNCHAIIDLGGMNLFLK